MSKKLKSIQARNFLGWQRLDLEFDKPVLLIVGDNATGKSTIKDAIEFAFTGKVPNRGVTKAKDQHLLRNDKSPEKSHSYVQVNWIEEGEEVSRKRSITDGLTDPDPNSLIPYCLNPVRYLKLSPSERAAILAQVHKPSEELIEKAYLKHLGKPHPLIRKEMVRVGYDTHDLDEIRKVAILLRQAAKRDLKGINTDYPQLEFFELPDDYPNKAADDKENLKKYEQDILAPREKLAISARHTAAKAQYIDAKNKVEMLKEKIKEVPYCEAHTLSLIEGKRKAIEIITEMLEETEGNSIICPICLADLSRGYYDNLLEKHKKSNESLDKTYLAHHEATVHNYDINQGIIIQEAIMDGLKASLEELPEIPLETTKVIEGQVETIMAKISDIFGRVHKYSNYTTALEVYREDEEKASQLVNDIDKYNEIDKALDDGGSVRAYISAQSKPLPFNRTLLDAWGCSDLEMKDNGEITVNGRAIELLSDSERYRVASAIALALAQIGDVGFCCLDGFEILLKDKRNELMASLIKENVGINNLIIIMSSVEKIGAAPSWVQVKNI